MNSLFPILNILIFSISKNFAFLILISCFISFSSNLIIWSSFLSSSSPSCKIISLAPPSKSFWFSTLISLNSFLSPVILKFKSPIALFISLVFLIISSKSFLTEEISSSIDSKFLFCSFWLFKTNWLIFCFIIVLFCFIILLISSSKLFLKFPILVLFILFKSSLYFSILNSTSSFISSISGILTLFIIFSISCSDISKLTLILIFFK